METAHRRPFDVRARHLARRRYGQDSADANSVSSPGFAKRAVVTNVYVTAARVHHGSYLGFGELASGTASAAWVFFARDLNRRAFAQVVTRTLELGQLRSRQLNTTARVPRTPVVRVYGDLHGLVSTRVARACLGVRLLVRYVVRSSRFRVSGVG